MKMPQPVRQRGGLGLLDWLDEFYWAWRVSRPLRSETCEVHESPDGTQILPRPSRSSSGAGVAAVPHPYQVLDASDEEGVKVKVYHESSLLKTYAWNSGTTIVAIDGGFALDEPFSLVSGELIWLEVDIEDLAVTSVTIKRGSTWTQYPSPVEWDSPSAENKAQLKARMLIAYTAAVDENFPDRLRLGNEEDGEFTVRQCLRDDLRLAFPVCLDGDSNVMLPVPWMGGLNVE